MKHFRTIVKALVLGAAFYILWSLFGLTILSIMATPAFVIYAHLLLLGFIGFCLFRRNKMNELYAVKMIALLERLARTLDSIDQALSPDGVAAAVEFYQNINGAKKKVDNMFMKVEAVADLAVAFKDRKGNPAKVDGMPQWALTNEALGTLTVAEDGMSAAFTAGGDAAQVGKIQVKADADLGEGVKEIIGELEIELSALDAEVVEISATVRP